MKKGINCHKDYSAVMANSGFGAFKLVKGGIQFTLPQAALRKKDGKPKIAWGKRLDSPTVADCVWMGKRGAEITVA